MAYENTPLTVKENEHRFSMMVDDEEAFIEFKKSGNKIYLVHTEVPLAEEGKGVAAALVEKTFQHLQDNHYSLVPICSYVQHYLDKHPSWNKLLAADTSE